MKRKRMSLMLGIATFGLLVGGASLHLTSNHPTKVEAASTYEVSFKSARSDTSHMADGAIVTNYLNITNNGPATITVTYNRNSAGTHSIFNNSSNEVRLYQGTDGDGGQITIGISAGYIMENVEITTSRNTGLSVNGAPSDTSKVVTAPLADLTSFYLKNVGTGQVRMSNIKIGYSLSGTGVPDPDPATSVTVSSEGGVTTLKNGRTLQLSAVVLPNTADPSVTWSSSDNNIATVDAEGLVTGVNPGSVTITATSTTPGISGSVTLTVEEAVILDGWETFENHGLTGTSYVSGSYQGDFVQISYAKGRKDEGFNIDGKSLMLGDSAGYIEFTLENGISYIEFEWMKAYTGAGNRGLKVLINGIVDGETALKDENGVIQTFSHTFATPYSGSTVVRIQNATSKQVTIDNIGWVNGPEVTFGTLTSIEVNSDEVNKEYYNGDTLDLSGLLVTAYDEHGNSKIVTDLVTTTPAAGYVFSEADATNGMKAIEVSYTEGGVTRSSSFTVNVTQLTLPTDVVVTIGDTYTGANDSSSAITLSSDIVGIFTSTPTTLLTSVIVQEDEIGQGSRVYYAGVNNSVSDIQPLKLGSGSGKGNIKLVFDDQINISKVTLYAARKTTSGTNVTLQVNNADVQTIGTSGVADPKFAAYVFEGVFYNEIIIRNNTNIAAYLYGLDIEYTTYEEDALAFANDILTGSGANAAGNCSAILNELEAKYEALSELAKLEFETAPGEVFASARARFEYLKAWVALNGGSAVGNNKTATESASSNVIVATIIGATGLAFVAGYYFINKKRRIN